MAASSSCTIPLDLPIPPDEPGWLDPVEAVRQSNPDIFFPVDANVVMRVTFSSPSDAAMQRVLLRVSSSSAENGGKVCTVPCTYTFQSAQCANCAGARSVYSALISTRMFVDELGRMPGLEGTYISSISKTNTVTTFSLGDGVDLSGVLAAVGPVAKNNPYHSGVPVTFTARMVDALLEKDLDPRAIVMASAESILAAKPTPASRLRIKNSEPSTRRAMVRQNTATRPRHTRKESSLSRNNLARRYVPRSHPSTNREGTGMFYATGAAVILAQSRTEEGRARLIQAAANLVRPHVTSSRPQIPDRIIPQHFLAAELWPHEHDCLPMYGACGE